MSNPPRLRCFTSDEDQVLLAAYAAGAALGEIAIRLNRVRNSIKSRLNVLDTAGRLPQRRPPVGGRPPATDDIHLTEEDAAWMAYWSQPRAVRRKAAVKAALISKTPYNHHCKLAGSPP